MSLAGHYRMATARNVLTCSARLLYIILQGYFGILYYLGIRVTYLVLHLYGKTCGPISS